MYTDIDLQALHMKQVTVNVTKNSSISGTLKFYYPNKGNNIVWYINCYGEEFGHSANVNFMSLEIIDIKENYLYLYKEK